ncbi:hypothetical protein BDR03DRAFT_957793, partial [Suillus americanus]
MTLVTPSASLTLTSHVGAPEISYDIGGYHLEGRARTALTVHCRRLAVVVQATCRTLTENKSAFCIKYLNKFCYRLSH